MTILMFLLAKNNFCLANCLFTNKNKIENERIMKISLNNEIYATKIHKVASI